MPLLAAIAVPVLTGTATLPVAVATAAAIVTGPIFIGANVAVAAGLAGLAIYRRTKKPAPQPAQCSNPNGACQQPDDTVVVPPAQPPAPSVGLVRVCVTCNELLPPGLSVCPNVECID